MNSTFDQVESILEDVDALIGSFIDAGEDKNAKALCEEFEEWFEAYHNGDSNIKILTIKVL